MFTNLISALNTNILFMRYIFPGYVKKYQDPCQNDYDDACYRCYLDVRGFLFRLMDPRYKLLIYAICLFNCLTCPEPFSSEKGLETEYSYSIPSSGTGRSDLLLYVMHQGLHRVFYRMRTRRYTLRIYHCFPARIQDNSISSLTINVSN